MQKLISKVYIYLRAEYYEDSSHPLKITRYIISIDILILYMLVHDHKVKIGRTHQDIEENEIPKKVLECMVRSRVEQMGDQGSGESRPKHWSEELVDGSQE